MKFIYIPPIYLLSRMYFFYLKLKSSKAKLSFRVNPNGMLNVFTAIKKHMFSPLRTGFVDLVKQLIAAYFVKPGDMVIDVGAHIGWYSSYYSDLVGEKGKVHSFEANPLIFQILSKRLSNRSNIFCQNHAISKESNKHVKMRLYPDDITQQCASIEPIVMNTQKMQNNTELITVTTKNLNDLINDNSSVCSLIKIDVEGHEHAVIDGAKELIEKDNPIIIYEYGYVVGEFVPTTIGQLKKHNYLSYDCKTFKQVDEGYNVPLTDLVAIPKEKQKEFEAFISLFAKK